MPITEMLGHNHRDACMQESIGHNYIHSFEDVVTTYVICYLQSVTMIMKPFGPFCGFFESSKLNT